MPLLVLTAGGAVASFVAGVAAGRVSGKYTCKKRARNGPGFWASPLGRRVHTPGVAFFGQDDAVVIVDPFSTGARLALEARQRGFRLIRVLSSSFDKEFLSSMLPEQCRDSLEFDETIEYKQDDPDAAIQEIRCLPYHVAGISVGCESGVEAFDAISEAMPGIVSNGREGSAARRDKFLMGERVRAAGLRAVRQRECSAWLGEAGARAFLQELGLREADDADGAWCVLKPTKSAGTDGVFISRSMPEAEVNFGKIIGAKNIFGDMNQSVLVQEFLKGKEYVVDSVSVEGEHKCVAIWEYDKRPCNGQQFVYFGMRLFQSATGKKEDALVHYVHRVLDALGVRHGPSHAEVIWLDGEDAPCLVEVGCRPHGGEGTFMDLVEPILGYSQVSVMADLLDRPYRFKRLPRRPAPFCGGAMEVTLVSREEGTLIAYPALEHVRQLESFKSCEIKVPVGHKLEKTVDFMTTPGSVMLVHSDPEVVERDQLTIHRLEEQGLFYCLAEAKDACTQEATTAS